MNARSAKPVRKVSAGLVGGALATVVMWVLDTLVAGQIPATVPTAVGVLSVALVAYLVPSADDELQPPAGDGPAGRHAAAAPEDFRL